MSDSISKNSIKRLALKASVGSLSSVVNDEIRSEISSVSKEICRKAEVLCESRKAVTISHGDIEGAVSSIHYLEVMKLGQPSGTKPRNVKACPDVASKTFGMRNQDKITKKRVYKSKRMFNCFNIPKSVFRKLMDINTPKRKSNDALIVFQEAVENHIINIFKHAEQMNENKIMKPKTIVTAINMIKGQYGKVEEIHKEKLDVYIRKVLRQYHPDTSISKDALFQLNVILNLIANKLASESLKLCRMDKKSTVSSRHLQQATRLTLSSEIAKYANAELVKAIAKASSHRPITTNRAHAELQFPPTRVGRFMSEQSGRTSVGAKIALACVIEYLCAELVETGGNVTRDQQKSTLTVRHLFLSIENDKEMSLLVKNTIGYKIPLSGVSI
jgi:histone H3/H4